MIDRRTFIELASGAALGVGCGTVPAFGQAAAASGAARIRLGLAGCGVRGLAVARMASGLPTCEVRAIADAYAGRRARAQEVIGREVAALDDARALVVRDDLDAIVIATPDHLHASLVEAATAAGKDVWVEAPATHAGGDAARLARIDARRVVQVATGAFTTPAYAAARRLVQNGALGRVLIASATWDSASSLHAWQLPYPPDASPESVAFAAFLGGLPARAFDPALVFRWPIYSAFGSGLVGMRLVPQIAAISAMLDLGAPDTVAASGGLHRWRDGRDTDDIVSATFEYAGRRDGGAWCVTHGRRQADRDSARRHRGDPGHQRAAPRAARGADDEPYPDAAETWPKGYRDWFYMMHGMSRDGQVRGVPDAERVVEEYDVPEGAGTATAPLAEFLEAVRTRGPVRESLARGLDASLAGQMVKQALRERRHVRRDEVAG